MITDNELWLQLITVRAAHDPEAVHILADRLLVKTLRQLGFSKAMDVYDDMEKWYA